MNITSRETCKRFKEARLFLYVAAFAGALSAFGADDPYNYKELVERKVKPVEVSANEAGHRLVDFGRDAVGWLEISGEGEGPYEIVIGELLNKRGEVTNEFPKSSIRCHRVLSVKGRGVHRLPIPPDRLNLRGHDPKAPAILLPERFGVVTAFRYAEVVSGPEMDFTQVAVNYPIDMGKSSFTCDSENLVRVYDMCKYSILATSFCGIYVDGDRERTPYEADAYINQLDHYAIDDDCSLARKSHEWLMDHPTWPTEWRQHSIKMAWADWMWTGDTRSIAKFYGRLADEKLLMRFAREKDGLLETGGERNKGAKQGAADIVDWPSPSRDGFEFRPVNSVVNAFHYRNLLELADIARALGKDSDSGAFAARARKVYAAYQRAFFDESTGLYVDGEGSRHSSLHANAAALAFGLVPQSRVPGVVSFLERKGMACSVYFAQYLLEALCLADRADLAVKRRQKLDGDDRLRLHGINGGVDSCRQAEPRPQPCVGRCSAEHNRALHPRRDAARAGIQEGRDTTSTRRAQARERHRSDRCGGGDNRSYSRPSRVHHAAAGGGDIRRQNAIVPGGTARDQSAVTADMPPVRFTERTSQGASSAMRTSPSGRSPAGDGRARGGDGTSRLSASLPKARGISCP